MGWPLGLWFLHHASESHMSPSSPWSSLAWDASDQKLVRKRSLNLHFELSTRECMEFVQRANKTSVSPQLAVPKLLPGASVSPYAECPTGRSERKNGTKNETSEGVVAPQPIPSHLLPGVPSIILIAKV